MPHLPTVVGASAPITVPDKGEQRFSEYEQGFIAGTARDPLQIEQVRRTGVPLAIPTIPPPEGPIQGVGRAPWHPATAFDLRSPWAPDAIFDNLKGTHVGLDQGAAIPRSGQRPMEGVQPNTWRAEPKPWDGAFYVGMLPAPEAS